jgi:hypothetical protein
VLRAATMQVEDADIDRFEELGAFYAALDKGDLALLKKLADAYSVTRADVGIFRCFALRSACHEGHLDMARWLLEEYGPPAPGCKNEVVCGAVRRRAKDVAVWAAGALPGKIDQDDLSRAAMAHGGDPRAEWLAQL